LGFAHAALPSSDYRIEQQHSRTQALMHHILRVSHVVVDSSTYGCSFG
jgi:hypothetical protein